MTWTYTSELGEKICEKMIEGLSIKKIAALDGMPSDKTIYKMMAQEPDFSAKCARARAAQAEQAIEAHGEVIDECRAGVLAPDVARVVLSGIQWRAAKFEPKKYGDSTTIKGDESAPIVTKDVTSPEVAARKVAAMLAGVAMKRAHDKS